MHASLEAVGSLVRPMTPSGKNAHVHADKVHREEATNQALKDICIEVRDKLGGQSMLDVLSRLSEGEVNIESVEVLIGLSGLKNEEFMNAVIKGYPQFKGVVAVQLENLTYVKQSFKAAQEELKKYRF